ncbi:hypothetical protein IJD34_03165 [bacterium]|nr:hypothetical protein [bacterium]
MKINPINVSTNYYGKQTQKPMYQSGVYEPSFGAMQVKAKSVQSSKILDFFKKIFGLKPKNIAVPKVEKVQLTPTQMISKEISSKYGIITDFAECLNVAECSKKMIEIYDSIFGKEYLPSKIAYVAIGSGTTIDAATYNLINTSAIEFNSNLHDDYYSSLRAMIFHSDIESLEDDEKALNEIIPIKTYSSSHPFHTYVHEFAHSAHNYNIYKNNGDVQRTLIANDLLNSRKLPTKIAQFFSRYKLGEYSNVNLKEFMAERISKDICENMDQNGVYTPPKEPLNYDNLFDRKWNSRFSCPQAYLDYYLQQVWTGRLELINATEETLLLQIAQLERQQVKVKQGELIGKLDYAFGKIREWGGKVTEALSDFADRRHGIMEIFRKDNDIQKQ